MKTSDMKLFCVLAQCADMTKAAKTLGLTPSAISQRLKALEENLQVPLVVRSTRRFFLTDEGRELAAGCRDILARMEALEDSVTSTQARVSGHLKINSSFGFGREVVAPAITRFALQYPDVRVQLSLTERPLDLVAEGYELGIYVSQLPNSRWHERRLFSTQRVLCAAPAYLESLAAPPKTPQDLATLATIDLVEDAETYGIWVLSRKGCTRKVSINPRFTTNDGDTAVSWALAGGGILLRSRWAIEEHLASGRLAIVLPEWHQSVDAHICWAATHLTAKARAFSDFFVDLVRAQVASREDRPTRA